MGYSTYFQGHFSVAPSLTGKHQTFLEDFAAERHGGPSFPGYYCQWVPDGSGTRIEWDGGEKFGDYEAWLNYLIEHFLAPWGYRIDGRVECRGEEVGDHGLLVATLNKVEYLPCSFGHNGSYSAP